MDWNPIWGALGATIPGILVALFGQWLIQRRENEQQQRINRNARALVALEVNANRSALATFWQTVNALDAEHADEPEKHLQGMALGGLLGYRLPSWNVVHWEHFSPEAAGGLSPTEIEKLYALYGNLTEITQLFASLITLSSEEEKLYSNGGSGQRFWYTYYPQYHLGAFNRLSQVASRVLDAANPLAS